MQSNVLVTLGFSNLYDFISSLSQVAIYYSTNLIMNVEFYQQSSQLASRRIFQKLIRIIVICIP